MWIPFQPTTLQKSPTSGPKVPLPPPHWERGHPRPHPFAYCELSGAAASNSDCPFVPLL